MPWYAGGFSPYQIIERPDNQKTDQNLWTLFHFLVPSASFLALVAAGCLLYWLSSALLSRIKKTSPLQSFRKKTQLKILAFFYVLFLFFIWQFFSGNLNTDNVVVSTDDLLYSEEQILRTQKEFCFFEKGPEENFLKNVRSSRWVYGHFNLKKLCLFRRRRTHCFTKSIRKETHQTLATSPPEIN